MTGTLVTLLVLLVVAALVYWGGHKIADAFGLPAPILVIFDVVLVILVVVYVLRTFRLPT
jgi:hypothetical protein